MPKRWTPTKTWRGQINLSSKHKAAAFNLGYLWTSVYMRFPAITNSQPHNEAQKHYFYSMEVDLWLARADMVNLCQSQAWYSTASWSSAINTSVCEQQIHQYNNQNKGFMVVSLMLPFLHHPSQFSYWVQCSLKNTFAIEKPRIEHSTFFYCVYISVQEDCGSDRETCQN